MTKEEFELRVTTVFELAHKLSTDNPDGVSTENDRGIAIAFYERLVEDFDARLETIMDDEMRHSKGGGLG